MKSRMDRYYHTETGVTRTSRNKELYYEKYNGDYELKTYSNVEGVAQIDKNNNIDLRKLQELLKRRELEKNNEKHHIVNRNIEQNNFTEEAEKDYDIKQVLTRAKTEKNDDNRTRTLDNTCYDILKRLDIKDENNEDANLQELIDKITNTKMLNINDKDLSLDMLADLKSDNNTQVINPSEMKSEIKKQADSQNNSNPIERIDNSFYTSSLGFKQEDFEELKDIQDSIKTNNKLIKFLVIILIVLLLSVFIFLFIL